MQTQAGECVSNRPCRKSRARGPGGRKLMLRKAGSVAVKGDCQDRQNLEVLWWEAGLPAEEFL